MLNEPLRNGKLARSLVQLPMLRIVHEKHDPIHFFVPFVFFVEINRV